MSRSPWRPRGPWKCRPGNDLATPLPASRDGPVGSGRHGGSAYHARLAPELPPHEAEHVARNVAAVRERIEAARGRGAHAAPAVRLVAVTNSASTACYAPLARAGVRDLGENRVQDAAWRKPDAPPGLTWHGIGHLQRNKIAQAVATFDVFHALDSLRLADALEAHLADRGRRWPVFVQVNASGEGQKGGFAPEEALGVLEQVLQRHPHLEPVGWMTMAAFGAPEGDLRRTFRTLRALRDDARRRGLGDPPPGELSMGMTDDFELAVEEGATVVRVGRALFEGVASGVDVPPPATGDQA